MGWIWSGIALMLLMACDSSDTKVEKQPTMLTVYVYSPDRPLPVRSSVGPVSATEAETMVTSLQIWIYDDAGKKVGYLNTAETATLSSRGATYQIPVSDEFAQQKPHVDVYVLANVTAGNCGITSTDFTSSTTRSRLHEKAKIVGIHYGLSPLTTAVPLAGLPMAGVLTDQPVIGDAPVLRIGTQSEMATVSLTRAVSKLRFFFANTTGASPLHITGITLNAGMIPDEEYLFPQGQALTYNTIPASLLSGTIANVATTPNPASFIYDGQTAQEYEALLTDAGLTETTPYYLRESDKKLEGTISYQVEGVEGTMTAPFRMSGAGDFMRNHSWIVYAYYEGLSGMQVVTVDVTPWDEIDEDHDIFNW